MCNKFKFPCSNGETVIRQGLTLHMMIDFNLPGAELGGLLHQEDVAVPELEVGMRHRSLAVVLLHVLRLHRLGSEGLLVEGDGVFHLVRLHHQVWLHGSIPHRARHTCLPNTNNNANANNNNADSATRGNNVYWYTTAVGIGNAWRMGGIGGAFEGGVKMR